MSESLAVVVERFLAHKRALARKYQSEARELRLLVRFTDEHGVTTLDALTPALLEDFLSSRPRRRPRSFNHLLGVVRCLLDWAVSQELLAVSPLRARPRRVTASCLPFLFDTGAARRLLEAAAALYEYVPGNKFVHELLGHAAQALQAADEGRAQIADCPRQGEGHGMGGR